MEYKIVQIIPATGWYVIYQDGPKQPLVCWALIEWLDNGDREIVAMDTDNYGSIGRVDGPRYTYQYEPDGSTKSH
jgi:hypothetical protein